MFPATVIFLGWNITNGCMYSNFNDLKEKKGMKDYTKDIGFWKRLQSFVTDVQTNCCMGEEEKQMIIHNCNLKKNKMRPKLSKWYAVPPYRGEGWKSFNEKGELVATFERQEDCEIAVKVYNAYVDSVNEKN